MRKYMSKEVTFTTLKLAKMDVVDGLPVAVTLPDETILGNISFEKAQKLMKTKYKGEQVTIFQHLIDTKVYEMEVEEFVKYAKEKVDNTNDNEEIE